MSPRSGERYDNQYCMVWRIEDGKIKQIKEYCDSALVERVLGPFPAERKLAVPSPARLRGRVGSHEAQRNVRRGGVISQHAHC